jgi:hypothetical protein
VKKKLIVQPRADLDLLRPYLYFAGIDPRKADQFRVAVAPARMTGRPE